MIYLVLLVGIIVIVGMSIVGSWFIDEYNKENGIEEDYHKDWYDNFRGIL